MEILTVKPFEIIIIDQTDNYPEDIKIELEKAIDSSTCNFIYQKSKIKSAGAARNLGVKLSTQDFIVFIDDDVILPADFCSNYYKAFIDNPMVDGIAGRVEEINQPIAYELPLQFKNKNTGFLFRPMNYGYSLNELADLGSCNMGIKKMAFLSLNGFDESMKRLEDSDLSLRFIKNNFRSIYDPSLYLIHKLVQTGANRHITRQHKYPNHLYWKEYFYFILKNCGLVKGRSFLVYYIKGVLWFKPLLIRPWHFIPAVFHLFKGAFKAKMQLTAQSKLIHSNA